MDLLGSPNLSHGAETSQPLQSNVLLETNSDSTESIETIVTATTDVSLAPTNPSLVNDFVSDSDHGKAAQLRSFACDLAPLHEQLKCSTKVELETGAQMSNSYNFMHFKHVDNSTGIDGTTIDNSTFQLGVTGTAEFVDKETTDLNQTLQSYTDNSIPIYDVKKERHAEVMVPTIMQPLQSAPKRKQHYWKQCDWRNLPMVKNLRENTLWTESSSELPKSYLRPTYLSNSDGDPRGFMKIADFARVLNLVTHNEANAYAVQHVEPVKRKRLATLNVKYDFSGDWGRRKLKSPPKDSSPVLKKLKLPPKSSLPILKKIKPPPKELPPVLKQQTSEVVNYPEPNDQCSMCFKTNCNILCDFCASSFHVRCLRVAGNPAPSNERPRGCPRCSRRTRPPKLQVFNHHDIHTAVTPHPTGCRRPSQRTKEKKFVRSGIHKFSVKAPAILKIKEKLAQRRQQLTRKNLRISKKLVQMRKTSKSEAQSSEFVATNTKHIHLPILTNASAGPSCAFQPGLSRKTIIVCNMFPTKPNTDKTDSLNVDVPEIKTLGNLKLTDSGENLKKLSASEGCLKSKKYRAFVRRAERVFTNETINRFDGNRTALSDLLANYESLHASRSLLESLKKNAEWQSRVQRGIMGEWAAAISDGATPINLLQNLKANIAATIALTDVTSDIEDYATTLGRRRDKSFAYSTGDSS